MSVELEHLRSEWAESHRRLEAAAGSGPRYERLHAQVDAVTAELRKRVGQTFTVAQLGAAYRDADRWAREVVGAEAPGPGWVRDVALVTGAAFHLYARGAADYAP